MQIRDFGCLYALRPCRPDVEPRAKSVISLRANLSFVVPQLGAFDVRAVKSQIGQIVVLVRPCPKNPGTQNGWRCSDLLMVFPSIVKLTLAEVATVG